MAPGVLEPCCGSHYATLTISPHMLTCVFVLQLLPAISDQSELERVFMERERKHNVCARAGTADASTAIRKGEKFMK